MSLWPHWQRPLWLLLLPLLAWLLWRLWHRQQRIGRWQLLLPPAFHSALLKGGEHRGSRLPWIALELAWLLALLALLGPSWQRLEVIGQKSADPLVVVLQLTPEMLAGDGSPTRLEQARHKLLDLLEARREAQTAIVVYAGSAHTLVPLSDDMATSRNLLEALAPSIMPVPGQRADLAVARAQALLEQAEQGAGRILLIGSALDEQEREGIRQALKGHATPLLILGVGSERGAPIQQEDGTLLKDTEGAILLPRRDSASLARFAQELGGRYANIRLDERDLASLGLLAPPGSLRNGEATQLSLWIDQGHWLLLPLLLLAACAGRRGWLFCLPLLLLVQPPPAQALEFADLWLRADQQGQRLLAEQRPAEAAQRFSDPQWQGYALYEAGDYAEAAHRFALSDTAAAHYNRGNALARAGELEAAVDAYEQALERQPDLQPALTNKALVEELLRQRQQQSASQGESEQTDDAEHADAMPGSTGQSNGNHSEEPAGGRDKAQDDNAENGENGGMRQSGDGSEADDAEQLAAASTEEGLQPDGEQRQELEQWLRQIPDDPGELLRRKFWYEQQQLQESQR